MASRSEEQRLATATRLTELFAEQANGYSDDQIGVFDVVIGQIAAGVGTSGRVGLSERLADIQNAPRGVIRQFALDDIAVARPVLMRSPRLSEQDLIAVATSRGRDHMLAITERPYLTAPVTDVLVVRGDRVVSHSLAANETASFSARGMGLLVTRALTDEALQGALGQRDDIPPAFAGTLEKASAETARRRLTLRASPDALDAGRKVVSLPRPEGPPVLTPGELDSAMIRVQELSRAKRLDEARVAGFAREGQRADLACALSLLGGLSINAVETALGGPDRDAVLVIGKALGWSWPTVKTLINLRPEHERLPHMLEKARSNYETLNFSTAQRVLQFIRVKDQTGR
jgi:hypothetical protein